MIISGAKKGGCGIAECCFTDIVLHSSMKEHTLPTANESCRPHKNVEAACGSVIMDFHGVSNL